MTTVSPIAGKVVQCHWDTTAPGRIVRLCAENGAHFLIHLEWTERPSVRVGDTVKAGQVIGVTGRSHDAKAGRA